jgi:hypothetical protein
MPVKAKRRKAGSGDARTKHPKDLRDLKDPRDLKDSIFNPKS